MIRYDLWESSSRLLVKSGLFSSAKAYDMFGMFWGWLRMSDTGPRVGTLLLNPLFKFATAYFLTRPVFLTRNGSKWISGR